MSSHCATDGCALDSRGCVSLDKILHSFGAPISEEQAWAICYGFAVSYLNLSVNKKRKLFYVTHLKHVILHKDGYVHDDTFVPCGDNAKGRQKVSSEAKLVVDLGVVLYRALEYSIGSDQERDLSSALDRLIDCMTSAEPEKGETDDEGIERDSGDSGDEHCGHVHEIMFTMRQALAMCEGRLVSEGAKGGGVDEHYRAVVRALIAEAVDLTSFLKKVAEGTRLVRNKCDLLSSEQDIHQLQSEDWAMLWKQVMKQLRDGVKLKKVEYTRAPLEYALTPYEMLMEDIRARRYTLNKIMVNGDIPPRLKKDAHTIILDFIRSRPPLKKASERKLAPFHKESSPMELLMDSIRKNDHRLKHVATPVRARPVSMIEPTRMKTISPLPKKKLIAAPKLNLSAEDDDEDLSEIPPASPRLSPSPLFGGESLSTAVRTHASMTTSPASPSSPASHTSETRNSTSSPLSRVAYDLANYGASKANGRRHSVSICETPAKGSSSGTNTPQNASGLSSRDSPSGTPKHQILASTSQTQRDFLSSSHFSSRLDCLSLTLEEVVHIRKVLAKADLEALPLDLSIKEDVAKGKICFLCMKMRFGFFGPRGRECGLCKRIICKKCVTKMRIPTEHFSNIPLIMLTPQSLSPKEEEEEQTHTSLPRTFLNMLQDLPKTASLERRSSIPASVGSAPSSPSTPRAYQGPSSLQPQPPAPCVNEDIQKKQEIRMKNTEMSERLRGQLMAVCLDCKAMVIHILLSIKLRKNHQEASPRTIGSGPTSCTPSEGPRSHLHLNLTPVYH